MEYRCYNNSAVLPAFIYSCTEGNDFLNALNTNSVLYGI